jgi:hypothetical protein
MSSTHGVPGKPRNSLGALAVLLPIAYVAGAAMYAGEARPLAWAAIAAAGIVAWRGARGVEGEAPGETRRRVVTWTSLAVVIATSAWSVRAPWAAALREVAAAVAAACAARALERIPEDVGLASAAVAAASPGLTGRGISWFATTSVVLAFGTAAIVDAAAWAGDAQMLVAAPLVAAGAGAAALFVLGAAALLVAGVRRLELGAPPRALACASTAGVALLSALALAIAGTLAADAVAALATSIAGLVVVRLAQAKDPIAVARHGRRALALLLFGGPVVSLAAMAGGGAVGLVLAILALAVGATVHKLEEPLLPVKGRLLDALAAATRAAHDRDAREAIARALALVRGAAGETASAPELWMLHAPGGRVFAADAAGYVRDTDAELPPMLLEVAAGEPDRTVRVDVLRALEVRRADLRPLLKWLEDRGALFATLVQGGDEPDGVVIAPAGSRTEPLAADEVRAARGLADAFVAVCQARSALERHLARERDLRGKIDALDDELAGVRHAATLDEARNVLASARLARPATVGIYSAASRMAYEALERRIERDAPVVALARPGVDPVPYLARAHLAGPRKDGPLVVVDGTSSREHDFARWRDPSASPLALADRGLLVLASGAALPRDVQLVVARALAERRPPWERATPLDVAIALTATCTPEELVETGRLAPELFARLEDAKPIELPGLRDRPEDLFSIVADRLARAGLRVRGKPFGIDAAAFARLVDLPFEGEDAELDAIVTRLAARARGDVVRAADVDALGLTPANQGGAGARHEM